MINTRLFPKKDIIRKFKQYEDIRILFKEYGYDMDKSRKAVLERAYPFSASILDVGTGPGRMSYTMAGVGFKVVSIDIDWEVQQIARVYAEKFGILDKIEFLVMDAQNAAFKDNSFSTVFSCNLLHDVNNPPKALEEIYRICNHKGKIVIADLNREGKKIVNKAYRINKKIHRSSVLNLDKVVGGFLEERNIPYQKFKEDSLDIYVGLKS